MSQRLKIENYSAADLLVLNLSRNFAGLSPGVGSIQIIATDFLTLLS